MSPIRVLEAISANRGSNGASTGLSGGGAGVVAVSVHPEFQPAGRDRGLAEVRWQGATVDALIEDLDRCYRVWVMPCGLVSRS